MMFSLIFAPLLLALSGYLIRFKKMTFLISGYNTSSKKEKSRYDEVALSKAVGNLLFTLAFFTAIPFISHLFFGEKFITTSFMISAFFTMIITIIAIIYMNTGNRFKKRNY